MLTMAKKKPQPAKPNPWPAKLRALRKGRGLTLAVAAAMVDTPISTWMSWEYRTRRPSKMAQRILISVFPELET